MMGLGANFTLRDMLILTMTSTRTHSVLKTQFLWVIGFHGFILIVFNLPDSSVSSQNLVFSHDGCQEEGRGGGGMFLKKRGMKKETGGSYTFLHYVIFLNFYCLTDVIK